MSSLLLKGIIRNGRVELPEPINLQDGTVVVVTAGGPFPDDDDSASKDETARGDAFMKRWRSFEFMTEDEQGDDPVLTQAWIDDLRSIPPLAENPEKEAEWGAWDETMRRYNVDAVRKQFEEGAR